MTPLLVRRAARRISLLTSLLGILSLILAAGIAFGAAVGDQVELQARIRAGVPLHQEPHGSNDFQRVPNGTKATVIDLTKDGHWLNLSLPDGRTGWVSARYIGDAAAGLPAPG